MVGGQYLAMAALVLMLKAVAMVGGQYLPMAADVGCVVVVWLRLQRGAKCSCHEVFGGV